MLVSSDLLDVVMQNEATVERVMKKATHYIVIRNKHGGTVLKTTYENAQTQGIIKHIYGNILILGRSAVRDIDPADDLLFMRIKTKKFEYLIASEQEFTIVVQQTRV